MQFKIQIEPAGISVSAQPDETLKDALEHSAHKFPQTCGGKGTCGLCRLSFLSEPPPMKKREIELLGSDSPYRLACLHKVRSDISVFLPPLNEWAGVKSLAGFRIDSAEPGLGIAADVGTTTVALYLADLSSGEILAQLSFLNPQLYLGADVMTRLELAKTPLQRETLTGEIRRALREGISYLLSSASKSSSELVKLTFAGNTAMSHLLIGVGGEGLERAPFRSPFEKQGFFSLSPEIFGLPVDVRTTVFPIIAGFVGGDTTAAVLAAGLCEKDGVCILMDLGTNGEIVVKTNRRIVTASAAAGPAFEGVGMTAGIPAVTGALEKIDDAGELIVIGGCEPRGICGSGYISALSYLHKNELLSSSGLLSRDSSGKRRWTPQGLNAAVITQDDIRKFQLAKGALSAGLKLLLLETGVQLSDIHELIITGSFGSRIDRSSAVEIGLLPDIPPDKITFIDNAAGRGASLCLGKTEYAQKAMGIVNAAEHINLGEHSRFQDVFIESLTLQRWK